MENMDFRNLRYDLKHNKKYVEDKQEKERGWQLYDRPLYEFGSTFSGVIPGEQVEALRKDKNTPIEVYGAAFRAYIEGTLSNSPNSERTAIEFGGSGSNLFAGFSNKFFAKTVGVCLDDIRYSGTKKDDQEMGHSVIVGDLLDVKNETMFKQITDALGTEKTDLIISRMMGPLKDLGKSPAILDRIIRKWYSILNDNGLIFAQFDYVIQHNPSVAARNKEDEYDYLFMDHQVDVENWVSKITENLGEYLEIHVARGVISIHKKPGAPSELPKLNELFG